MSIRSQENLVGARAFLVGIILAIVVGILSAVFEITINPFIAGILALLGLVVGFFVAEREVHSFLLASVSLVIVSFAGMQGIVISSIVVGVGLTKLISSVLGTLLLLFVPATIVVVIKAVFALAKS